MSIVRYLKGLILSIPGLEKDNVRSLLGEEAVIAIFDEDLLQNYGADYENDFIEDDTLITKIARNVKSQRVRGGENEEIIGKMKNSIIWMKEEIKRIRTSILKKEPFPQNKIRAEYIIQIVGVSLSYDFWFEEEEKTRNRSIYYTMVKVIWGLSMHYRLWRREDEILVNKTSPMYKKRGEFKSDFLLDDIDYNTVIKDLTLDEIFRSMVHLIRDRSKIQIKTDSDTGDFLEYKMALMDIISVKSVFMSSVQQNDQIINEMSVMRKEWTREIALFKGNNEEEKEAMSQENNPYVFTQRMLRKTLQEQEEESENTKFVKSIEDEIKSVSRIPIMTQIKNGLEKIREDDRKGEDKTIKENKTTIYVNKGDIVIKNVRPTLMFFMDFGALGLELGSFQFNTEETKPKSDTVTKAEKILRDAIIRDLKKSDLKEMIFRAKDWIKKSTLQFWERERYRNGLGVLTGSFKPLNAWKFNRLDLIMGINDSKNDDPMMPEFPENISDLLSCKNDYYRNLGWEFVVDWWLTQDFSYIGVCINNVIFYKEMELNYLCLSRPKEIPSPCLTKQGNEWCIHPGGKWENKETGWIRLIKCGPDIINALVEYVILLHQKYGDNNVIIKERAKNGRGVNIRDSKLFKSVLPHISSKSW